jgi:hypothetical protein
MYPYQNIYGGQVCEQGSVAGAIHMHAQVKASKWDVKHVVHQLDYKGRGLPA